MASPCCSQDEPACREQQCPQGPPSSSGRQATLPFLGSFLIPSPPLPKIPTKSLTSQRSAVLNHPVLRGKRSYFPPSHLPRATCAAPQPHSSKHSWGSLPTLGHSPAATPWRDRGRQVDGPAVPPSPPQGGRAPSTPSGIPALPQQAAAIGLKLIPAQRWPLGAGPGGGPAGPRQHPPCFHPPPGTEGKRGDPVKLPHSQPRVPPCSLAALCSALRGFEHRLVSTKEPFAGKVSQDKGFLHSRFAEISAARGRRGACRRTRTRVPTGAGGWLSPSAPWEPPSAQQEQRGEPYRGTLQGPPRPAPSPGSPPPPARPR